MASHQDSPSSTEQSSSPQEFKAVSTSSVEQSPLESAEPVLPLEDDIEEQLRLEAEAEQGVSDGGSKQSISASSAGQN
jgi:hypothetical protein